MPTGPRPDEVVPQNLIGDAAHAGKPHFFFLPPVVDAPVVDGAFDPTLTPSVEICALSGDACSAVVAQFASGTGSDHVRLDAAVEHYIVDWRTGLYDLDPEITYRIRVLFGEVELGFADVDVVAAGRQLRNVLANEYIPLLDGKTLPIAFRIEEGFLARISVTPNAASVVKTMTQQFTAVAYDLHGATLPATFTWASGNETVATVDQTGLATAVANGAATISASAVGQTGNATLIAPVDVVSTIGVSLYQSCAIARGGAAYCWGKNDYGQLGTGDFSSSAVPVPVVGGHLFESIVTGARTSCGLEDDGAAWCWGLNVYGAVGQGAFSQYEPTPRPVAGNHVFESITAGYEHNCGLTAGGEAWCWGRGDHGELGQGNTLNAESPMLITGFTFKSLSAGLHTCGATTGGQAYCWGYNLNGAVGNGSVGQVFPYGVLSPAQVVGGLTFESMHAGWEHTCALDASGAAYCWGYNRKGQLGTDLTNAVLLAPTAVAGGHSFATLTGGWLHTCGIRADGAGYCWGDGTFGALGTGNRSDRYSPVPIIGGDTWTSLSAGGFHTCGVTTSGAGQCWGTNFYLQLGNGSSANSFTPGLIAGGMTFEVP